MESIAILKYNKCYLNSFHPLCENEYGVRAFQDYGLLPFIDASCRREPDFENEYPSITALCRGSGFAPHLRMNDLIIYMTVKGKYLTDTSYCNRLVAILQVIDIYEDHKQAYYDYFPYIPNNCLVDGNDPNPFEKTSGGIRIREKAFKKLSIEQQIIEGNRFVRGGWDGTYHERIKKNKMLIKTKAIYKNLTSPPAITKEDILTIFGTKSVYTLAKKEITPTQFKQIAQIAMVNIIL